MKVDYENGELLNFVETGFGTWDYVIFAILLLFSASIGVYIWWQDRANDDEDNYATGGRSFSAIPGLFA